MNRRRVVLVFAALGALGAWLLVASRAAVTKKKSSGLVVRGGRSACGALCASAPPRLCVWVVKKRVPIEGRQLDTPEMVPHLRTS